MFFRNHLTIEEILSEMRPPEPGFAGVTGLFDNARLLVNFSRLIGASRPELSYLTRRRNYIAVRCLVELVRSIFTGSPCSASPGLYFAYTEICVRASTLCEIYKIEAANDLRKAIISA